MKIKVVLMLVVMMTMTMGQVYGVSTVYDYDGSGVVDAQDLYYVGEKYSYAKGEIGFIDQLDFDYNDIMDIVDLIHIAKNFGNVTNPEDKVYPINDGVDQTMAGFVDVTGGKVDFSNNEINIVFNLRDLPDTFTIASSDVEVDDCEYSWEVYVTDDDETFSFGVMYFKFEEDEENKVVGVGEELAYYFQTDSWVEREDGGFYVVDTSPESVFDAANNTITITALIPHTLDLEKITNIEVSTFYDDGSQNHYDEIIVK